MVEERAWKDARELEYLRIDTALRNRMNFTLTRNVHAVSSEPGCLLQMAELDGDIWDCVRPYFGDDPRRGEIDKGVDWLRDEANYIFSSLGTRKRITTERITHFFSVERDTFRLIMDMRHEKGLDIGFKKEWTNEQEKEAMRNYTSGGKFGRR